MREIASLIAMLFLLVGGQATPVSAATGEHAYKTTIEFEAEAPGMRAAVAAASLLVSLEAEPVDDPAILVSRAREDEQRMTRALNALGYFSARVLSTVGGISTRDAQVEERLDALAPGDAWTVIVKINPGRLFVLGDLRLQASGGATTGPDAVLTQDSIGLKPGLPAVSANIGAANGRAIEILREQGFARARLADRMATADHATAMLDLTLVFDTGPRVQMGPVAIEGAQRMNPGFVAGLAPFSPGDPFSASRIREFRDSIERLNVFDAVAIDEASALDESLRLPLTVTVHERPLRAVGVAGTWSTRDGGAVSTYWEHRNLFGEAERLRIEASSSRLFLNAVEDYEYALRTALTLPAWPDRRDDARVSVGLKRERPDAYTRNALDLELGWTRRFDRSLSLEAGVTLARSREDDAFGTRDLMTLSLPLVFLYDTRNDALEPVEGIRASAELRPLIDLLGNETAAARLLLQGSTYARLDAGPRTILAGRASLGLSIGADAVGLPADLRFFSGGGGSVRGYAYQGLAPRDTLDRIIGGASLAEASVEVRHWIWDDIGAAAFVDTGAAFSGEAPDFDGMGTGVGLGVRYRTPVGPLRLDIAIPLDPAASDPDFAVYVGLGQAF